MVKLIFIAIIIGVVAGLGISYGYWIPRIVDIQSIVVYNSPKPFSNLPVSNTEATESAVMDPASIIKETSLENGWKLIEVEKPNLSLKIPASWFYNFEYFQEFEFNGKKYYHLNGVINNGSGKVISIIVNFQGGWCEGPEKVDRVRLSDRFGLPAQRFDCDPTKIYVYGDLDMPGSTIPNLFVSLPDGEDQEVKEIFESIEHSPEQSGNLKFKVINYTY